MPYLNPGNPYVVLKDKGVTDPVALALALALHGDPPPKLAVTHLTAWVELPGLHGPVVVDAVTMDQSSLRERLLLHRLHPSQVAYPKLLDLRLLASRHRFYQQLLTAGPFPALRRELLGLAPAMRAIHA